ncbi:MAG: hypothetical protein LBO62_05615, partial [Endomicrobium sp.]|nr:hypothetical protein [Endomicrobium sp.]
MMKIKDNINKAIDVFLDKFRLSLRSKLVIIFLIVKVIPLVLLTFIAWNQIKFLGNTLKVIAVEDSTEA